MRARVIAMLAVVCAVPGLASGAAAAPAFSGERAMVFLDELCALGPRVPGTDGHDRAFDYLRARLLELGAALQVQEFELTPAGYEQPIRFKNLIGSFHPERQSRALLGAHWDSRPWADADPDSSRHREPVLGANDSASGCAVLLTLAELVSAVAPAYGVDIVFFDGEDLGQHGDVRTFCLGSQEYVRRMVEPPLFVIILDMIGGRDLRIVPERQALQLAPALTRHVWERAELLGIDALVDGPAVEVFDDHVPFLEAGVPAADLIDFTYAYWHTVDDTPDKCSASSLGLVGELVASLIYDP